MKRYLLTALLVLGFAVTGYAAPVGLTSEADLTEGELWADKDIGVSVGVIVDSVAERGIDIDKGEFEMDLYAARLGVNFIDRFNVYVDIGQVSGMGFTFEDKGELINVDYEDEMLYGVGVNALIYRWDNGLELGAGASYRTAEMSIDSATIDSAAVAKADMSAYNNGDFTEQQIALEVAWRGDIFVPYAGIKYSDVEVDADFTTSGSQRKATGQGAGDVIGAFVGLSIAPKLDVLGDKAERIAINVEGRFVDEEAISGSVTYKF